MRPTFLSAVASLGGGDATLETVLSQIRFGVFVDQVEEGCIYANAEVLRMFQMDWESFRGFGWARAVVAEDMELMREAIERYEMEKDRIEVRYRIELPDGSRRALHVVGQAVLDANGAHLGSVMIGREVTAERAVQEEVSRLQKLDAVGRLASRIAHDFNNVLTPIMFSSDLLREQTLTEDAAACVDIIRSGAEHAAAITRQLLSLSRQQVGDPTRTPVDVELRAKEPLLRQLLGERVTLELALDAPDAEVMLAPHELSQIVINLAANGRDAIDETGAVRITTRLEDGQVEVEVTDSGAGMTAEVQRRAFEPFFTTKTADRGTGLGLYTVRELVERAGGAIGVASEAGDGTTFRLTFPCIVRSTEARPSGRPQEPLAPQHVLLVDDNSALRQALAYALALQGHTVKASASVGRARELIREELFDVIVTDLLLPDGNGVELVADARGIQPEVRVIYISGFAGSVHDELNLDQARTLFLAKPFHASRLAEAMAEVVRERASQSAG